MSLLLYAFVVIVFVVGLSTPWLIAWTVAGMLPSWISEPLANLCMTVAFSPPGRKFLDYTDEGLYEIEVVNEDDIDNGDRNWTVFAGSAFAVGYERTKRTFGSMVRDISITDMYEMGDATELSENKSVTEITRGGFKTFVDTTYRAKQASIHILAGEFLALFKGVAGARETVDAENAAMYKFGGDTSAESPRVRLIGAIIFAIMGFIPSWIIFM